MAKLDKEAVEDCLYDYGRLMWNCKFYAPEHIVDAFFEARGTNRVDVQAAAEEYGIIFTSATLADNEPEEKEHPFVRLMKWVWK